MRRHEQLSLERPYIEHSHAAELAEISQILSLHPDIAELVGQDLVRGLACPQTGARGGIGDLPHLLPFRGPGAHALPGNAGREPEEGAGRNAALPTDSAFPPRSGQHRRNAATNPWVGTPPSIPLPRPSALLDVETHHPVPLDVPSSRRPPASTASSRST